MTVEGLPDDARWSCSKEVLELVPERALCSNTRKYRVWRCFPRTGLVRCVEPAEPTEATDVFPVVYRCTWVLAVVHHGDESHPVEDEGHLDEEILAADFNCLCTVNTA